MGAPRESPAIPSTRRVEGFRVAAECRPAEEVAGDFYLVTSYSPGRIGVVIGDACGRGRQGAALLPDVLPRLRQLARAGARPGRLLTELNRTAVRVVPVDRFITAAALLLDSRVCTLTVANAGHVPVLIRSAQSNVRIVGCASGPPLGVVPNAAYFEDCVPFRSGDVAVLMTDGVLETLETDLGCMSTLKRLLAAAPDGAGAIQRWLLTALDRRFRRDRPDDVTLLSVEACDPAVEAFKWAG
jgi:serine phosphatase RsbU (regulator of sigma subunit)